MAAVGVRVAEIDRSDATGAAGRFLKMGEESWVCYGQNRRSCGDGLIGLGMSSIAKGDEP